jgi:hypothetical protein
MEFRATKSIGYSMLKDGTCTNTQDGTGIQTKRQTRYRSTKNKMEREINSLFKIEDRT